MHRKKYVIFAFSFIFINTHTMQYVARGGNMGLSSLRALQTANQNKFGSFSNRGPVLIESINRRSSQIQGLCLDSALSNQSLCGFLIRSYTSPVSSDKDDQSDQVKLLCKQIELQERQLELMEKCIREQRKGSEMTCEAMPDDPPGVFGIACGVVLGIFWIKITLE